MPKNHIGDDRVLLETLEKLVDRAGAGPYLELSSHAKAGAPLLASRYIQGYPLYNLPQYFKGPVVCYMIA